MDVPWDERKLDGWFMKRMGEVQRRKAAAERELEEAVNRLNPST